MSRGRVNPYEVFRQQVCTLGGITQFQTQFPMGKPWHSLDLLFDFSVTQLATPGVGPILDGLLKAIRAISFFSPKNEYIFNQVPGRLAYVIAIDAFDYGAPRVDSVTTGAASSTQNYVVLLRIPMYDPLAYDPSDFILDTLNYSTMTLTVQISSGGTDLYTTPNTAVLATCSLTATLIQEESALVVQANMSNLPMASKDKMQKEMGKFYLTHGVAIFGDPTAVGFLDIPRSSDLAYYKYFVGFFQPTVSAGQPFDGISDNIGTRFTDFTLQVDTGYPIKQVRALYLQAAWQARVSTFSASFFPNSYWQFNWSSRGQKQAAMYSGDKALLRLTWNASGAPPSAGSQLAIGYKGFRARVA